jgi:hypothetical protein
MLLEVCGQLVYNRYIFLIKMYEILSDFMQYSSFLVNNVRIKYPNINISCLKKLF